MTMKTRMTTPKHSSLALIIGAMFSVGVMAAGLDDLNTNGIKLRGDGSVDDNQIGLSLSDMIFGVKLRGDGSVDDSQPGTTSASNDIVNGVKLRGDGSVDC
jgi:hypothetical protein